MNGAHGVSYSSDFLSRLPQPTPPVRLLPAQDFAQLHLSHILSHPQDHVLFPFLHGLEGDNDAQNGFFASAPNAHETHVFTDTHHPKVKIPKYRGLIWVVCEEDLEAGADLVTLRILRRKNLSSTTIASSPDGSMYSSGSESFEEDDDEDYEIEDEYSQGGHSDVRVGVVGSDENAMQLSAGDTLPIITEDIKEKTLSPDLDNQPHMHPVNHRSIHTATSIPLASSVSSTDTSASSTASSSFDTSTSSSTSPDSDLTSFSSCSVDPDTVPGLDSKAQTQSAADLKPRVTDPAAPPLLTGTFRPKELLRRIKRDGGYCDWEFTPAKVPEGISLRNFGIQVPIYATISDIVVYSPKGASPAAVTLAQRFTQAIRAKRKERIQALGLPDEDGSNGLLHYNVFVLDAAEERMRKELAHLMMRICVEPVSGGLFGTRNNSHGAHTDGSDGHIVELGAVESREREQAAVGEMDMVVDGPSQERQQQEEGLTIPFPNTVDFAQREKEEMRDLTKASEIVSLFPALPPSPEGSSGWNTPDDGSSVQQRPRSLSSASSRHPYRSTRPPHLQFLPQVQPHIPLHNNFTFSPPDINIDISSTASFYDPHVGQIFLGNSGDVPLAPERLQSGSVEDDPFDYRNTNNPQKGFGYDICIECHDLATFPSAAHLRAAEEHLSMVDLLWLEKCERQLQERFDQGENVDEEDIPTRPPPHANAVIHLTLPSSPASTQATLSSFMPVVRFLEKWLRPIQSPPCIDRPSPPTPHSPGNGSARRWSSMASFMPSFVPLTSSSPPKTASPPSSAPSRNRSFTSPIPSVLKPKPRSRPTRPLKVLMYSSDGYTESSVPALCLLMAIKGLSLPEAYLELQVAKRRSFFVYHNDLGLLRRMEARLREERERSGLLASANASNTGANASPRSWGEGMGSVGHRRPAAKSVSFATPPSLPGFKKVGNTVTPPLQQQALEEDVCMTVEPQPVNMSASVDGSFPSRVLPFLYLGNLNHAANAYMLHALGITHVVSVGECALVPPGVSGGPGISYLGPNLYHRPNSSQYTSKGPGMHGSLWIEEREGRIKVLDIKGVCDDGIDTLEPQLEPICEWIDKARQEGGQVLVHCRVGVSRSATVTIAYVMKHLNLPLVDAYLIVRSRRLSVLIQPNMRLLYNLCGWEIKLAKDRAGRDEGKLKRELSRMLSWPYLAKEVHALNEKYLH
ncbi:hypothetical protein AGABI2DRAFT_177482 [Agaricus bisporus var. bisporus H97]|uniref:hypothetical protein n=1 Tax=Agaricus bisporus var. bisporus (strain H97 / ATCC MYA-4626 / FGSC 10389) TaxID=936046 RepID=UPI00029F69DF|nr:hypothetical protein AGABI2DRAFT_177482 [Agaricus bisporus var. bisporus H97]EKV49532.1 hypothetical protein AGABI2DRAFT_177482 [Agaricus bisporus var. bisporus H97]